MQVIWFRRILLMLMSVVIVGCANISQNTNTADHAPHWSYTGESGPVHWGDLAPEYALCANGTEQTPIDIVPATRDALANPAVQYQAGAVTVVNNGHTVQANAAPGNRIVVDGVEYSLAQMHFHTPSEHHINGVPALAEVHFVHKAIDGTLAVVGVLIEASREDNLAWASFVAAIATNVDESTTTTLDWPTLLPTDLTTYRYRGSLTTPPCSEGVQWMVLQTPIMLSDAQIAAFTTAYDGNARPVQELNNRTVVTDSSDS